MKLSLRSLSLATVAAATLAVAPAAHADTFYDIGNTAPTTVGGVLSTTSGFADSILGTYTIGYTANVWRDAAGTLDFSYQITSMVDHTTPLDAVTQLSIGLFTPSVLTAVAAVGSGQAPTSPADLNLASEVLDVSFADNAIGNNDTSQVIWLITDATMYTYGTFSSQDGSVAQLAGYMPVAPTTPTPEPSTFALMGTGLLAAAGAVRRRMKA
ncbi:MAG: PEP-CTERM sorting domain-containing protein [Edaphobacter sp.]